MTTVLVPQELTDEAFAPYGAILDPDRATPKMKEHEFTFWDSLAEMDIPGRTTVALLEVKAREAEFSNMERHTQTEEVFFALDGPVVAIVGAPTPGQDHPDPSMVRAFRLQTGKGVLLWQGTWHWLPYPLQGNARLLVIFRKGTADEDLYIRDMQEARGIGFRIEA